MKALTAALLAMTAMAPAAVAEDFGDWQVHQDGGRCWASTSPKDGAGAAYLSVLNQPSESVRGSLAAVSGNPDSGKGDVELKVDGRSFEMLAFEQAAFARSGGPEADLISAMRKGREVSVRWTSANGSVVEHRYSLSGFSGAKSAIDSACR